MKIDIEVNEFKLILKDMAKDIKDMKVFMQVLTNKLGGL